VPAIQIEREPEGGRVIIKPEMIDPLTGTKELRWQ
jgi:hypothetical protein